MIKTFKWTDGCRKIGDANKVGKRLEKIRQGDGGQLHIDSALADAKDPYSPLHPYITWNIKEAAQKCWRSEIREVIRSLRVCTPGEPLEERIYALNLVGEPNIYREASEVMADPRLAPMAKRQAISYLHAAQRKLNEIKSMKVYAIKVISLVEEVEAASI